MMEFKDIDLTYSESIQNLSNIDKVEYLEKVIDEKQNILSKSGNLISVGEKMKLMEYVKAAQKEIRALHTEKTKVSKPSDE